MDNCTLLYGDAAQHLLTLAPKSIQTVVTSPPYYGLRSYLPADHPDKHLEIGQESSPTLYIERLLYTFRRLKRVLCDNGTFWLNIGDSYARQGGAAAGGNRAALGMDGVQARMTTIPKENGLKQKDLIGIPWMLAFALRDDGWYLRQDICWSKPNPMPESVRDRCTRSHEYVFMFSLQPRYYYDHKAIAEPTVKGAAGSSFLTGKTAVNGQGRNSTSPRIDSELKNRRSVWSIAPQPFPGSHYAVMPDALAELCVLAGSRLGDTALDPFAGTGTTGRVALKHGRKFVGIDLDDRNRFHAHNRLGFGEESPEANGQLTAIPDKQSYGHRRIAGFNQRWDDAEKRDRERAAS